MIGALFFRPNDAGGFHESSADKASTLLLVVVLCPMAPARFGEMFVLQSSMYSSSGTSERSKKTTAVRARVELSRHFDTPHCKDDKRLLPLCHYTTPR